MVDITRFDHKLRRTCWYKYIRAQTDDENVSFKYELRATISPFGNFQAF